MRPSLLVLPIAIAVALPIQAWAANPASFEWNLRLRSEHVEDEAFARDADAITLRLRAGLRLKFDSGLHALVEGEGIADAGDRYNSGANGRTDRPIVPDPEGVELNQAYVGWKNKAFGVIAGRQRLSFDNQRWVGNSGWRQNEQTFDAVALEWQPVSTATLHYAFLDRVHRINGDEAIDPLARERSLSTHLVNLSWKQGQQQLVAYGYLHEDRDVASASTVTWGGRWSGARLHDGNGPGLTIEAARQRDYADNPLSFSHAYWLLEPTLGWNGVTWRLGWEHLGGNGVHALQTPLATLHAFDGWADRFTTTPPGGLDDRYIGAGGTFGRGSKKGKFIWLTTWHEYRADTGGRYGREWDASWGFPVRGPLNGLVKFADYRADGFSFDTRKLWLQLEWTR